MSQIITPREVVDRQLRAYNDRDLDAYCQLFAPDVRLSRLDTGEEFVRGMDALRAFYTLRFSVSRLHCQIRSRIELGRYVVDHELIDGIEETQCEVIAIYEVCHSLINTVRFIWPEHWTGQRDNI